VLQRLEGIGHDELPVVIGSVSYSESVMGGLVAAPRTAGYARAVAPPLSLSASHAGLHADRARLPFAFVAERLWLDFVNTDAVDRGTDALGDFERFVRWMEAARVFDSERASAMHRRAQQQPSGALAVLGDARRVRAVLRTLAERGVISADARLEAVGEINRVLGRSAGTRRLELHEDGSFARAFVPVGDAFAGLLIPVVESAADALILSELARVRLCADQRCGRVFQDETKNGRRRWCDMATCGNRAKAARHRMKLHT
jgi:predicted RNA-binding Zn ribbon-like protein